MEELWVTVRKMVKLADKATVTITGLRDSDGYEVEVVFQFEQGVIVGYTQGSPPVKEEQEGP